MKPNKLNPAVLAGVLAMAAGIHPQALAYMMPESLRSKPKKKAKAFTQDDQEALDRAEAKRQRRRLKAQPQSDGGET